MEGKQIDKQVEGLQQLADTLDSTWRVPGTPVRFGMDALVGLIPGIGDALSGLFSIWIVLKSWRLGVSFATLVRMLVNVGVDVLVGALLGDLVGEVEELAQLVAEMHLAAGAFHFGQAVDRVTELRAQQVHVGAGLGQQATNGAALLIKQRNHDVRRLDELVVLANSQGLRIGQRELKFASQFVQAHGDLSTMSKN